MTYFRENLTYDTETNFHYVFSITGQTTAAFTVVMTTDEMLIPQGSIVEWEAVVTNLGGGYNANTFTFTCPEEGHYYFTVNVGAINANRAQSAVFELLYDNNESEAVVTSAMARTGDWGHGAGTASATINCSSGGKVRVRCASYFDGRDCEIMGGPWRPTTFSGFLL